MQKEDGKAQNVDEFMASYCQEVGYVRPGETVPVRHGVLVRNGVHLATELYGEIHKLELKTSYNSTSVLFYTLLNFSRKALILFRRMHYCVRSEIRNTKKEEDKFSIVYVVMRSKTPFYQYVVWLNRMIQLK